MKDLTLKKITYLFVVPILFLFVYGCGPGHKFKKAKVAENKGFYVEAGMRYESIFSEYPDSAYAPEALYNLGRIYQKKLKLYSQSTMYFNKLSKKYPKVEPWSSLAKLGMMNSPDYFPLSDGSFWIEGDSQTKGRNMQAEWNCKEVSTGTFVINRKISAGSKLVATVSRYYVKQNMEVREYENFKKSKYSNILFYPYAEGKTWKTEKNGREVIYKILSKTVALNVKAGEFTNCLKISEVSPTLPDSIKYNYYAPDTGWVLTTISASGGKEHRNTELLSYKILPD